METIIVIFMLSAVIVVTGLSVWMMIGIVRDDRKSKQTEYAHGVTGCIEIRVAEQFTHRALEHLRQKILQGVADGGDVEDVVNEETDEAKAKASKLCKSVALEYRKKSLSPEVLSFLEYLIDDGVNL